MNSLSLSRREFAAGIAGTALVAANLPGVTSVGSPTTSKQENGSSSRPIYKSVKWGMIDIEGTVLEKFQLCEQLGYDGMELISPADLDPNEVRRAADATGMPVHGVVDMKHWSIRLSSPDPTTRQQGREFLQQAIRDAKSFGGDSVLLVPGAVKGKNENHDHVWQRSIIEIRKVLPLASRLGVRVLIENVWNGFCETPEQLRDYLDEIDSPWVGAYFDIGNVVKFSPSEKWIRTLGSRIVKLDVKDWGNANGFCKIGDGDVNWPEVRNALQEIQFTGWSTAEVAGGGRDRLTDIAARMDRVLVQSK